MDGMYAVYFKKVGEQQGLAAPDKDAKVLEVWHARLTHSERLAVQRMPNKDVVWGKDMRRHSVLEDCFPCTEGTMTKWAWFQDPCAS